MNAFPWRCNKDRGFGIHQHQVALRTILEALRIPVYILLKGSENMKQQKNAQISAQSFARIQ